MKAQKETVACHALQCACNVGDELSNDSKITGQFEWVETLPCFVVCEKKWESAA